LHSDEDAVFDAVVELNGAEIEPQVSWGTSPEMVAEYQLMPDLHLNPYIDKHVSSHYVERHLSLVLKRKVASTIKQAMIVPGSGLVKQQAEKEGLDKIFLLP
jgi:3-isopropylmalate/(R)-2-methylmalate dehydratase large subunit